MVPLLALASAASHVPDHRACKVLHEGGGDWWRSIGIGSSQGAAENAKGKVPMIQSVTIKTCEFLCFFNFLLFVFLEEGCQERGWTGSGKKPSKVPDRFYKPGSPVSCSFSKKYMVDVGGSKNMEQIHPQPS